MLCGSCKLECTVPLPALGTAPYSRSPHPLQPLTRWANRAATGSTSRSGTRLRGQAGGGKPMCTCPLPVEFHRVWPVTASGQCGKVCRREVAGRGLAAQQRKKVELQSKGQELRGQRLLGRHQQTARGPPSGGSPTWHESVPVRRDPEHSLHCASTSFFRSCAVAVVGYEMLMIFSAPAVQSAVRIQKQRHESKA